MRCMHCPSRYIINFFRFLTGPQTRLNGKLFIWYFSAQLGNIQFQKSILRIAPLLFCIINMVLHWYAFCSSFLIVVLVHGGRIAVQDKNVFSPNGTGSVRQTGEWGACSSIRGMCIDVNSHSCSVDTKTGICQGPSNVQCCPYPGGIEASACSSDNEGVCILSDHCQETFKSGLCPGPSSVKCCPNNDEGDPTRYEWSQCVNGAKGVCIDTGKTKCSVPLLTNKCNGPKSIRCCPRPGGVPAENCHSSKTGFCSRVETCSSSGGKGKCPGPVHIQCCKKKPSSSMWQPCRHMQGVCINVKKFSCSSATFLYASKGSRSRTCNGSDNMRCCPKPAGVKSGSCHKTGLGLCMHKEQCANKTTMSDCPGPSTIRCCPTSRKKFSSCKRCKKIYKYDPDGPDQMREMQKYASAFPLEEKVREEAAILVKKEYPDTQCSKNECDAFRHALRSQMLRQGLNTLAYVEFLLMDPSKVAKKITNYNERKRNNKPKARCMDLHNNWVGLKLAEENPDSIFTLSPAGDKEKYVKIVRKAISDGLLILSPKNLC